MKNSARARQAGARKLGNAVGRVENDIEKVDFWAWAVQAFDRADANGREPSNIEFLGEQRPQAAARCHTRIGIST